MPEVTVTIGGREFEVACQAGEEHYLKAAAQLLDTEATAVNAQIGRVPESRMLLMAGLMLADKAAGVDEQLRFKDEQVAKLEAQLQQLRSRPEPEARKVEVPVIPESVAQSMAQFAARAEAMAAALEEKVPAAD